MRSYFLIDGMMIYDVIRAQEPMHDKKTNWHAPVMPNKTDDLVGPLLFDTALVKAASETANACMARLINAFPYRQHLSTIYSQTDLATLAQHLQRFAAFYNEDGKLLALRFADCRRLTDMPQVLTTQQWSDMTSLMAHWYYHDRRGNEATLYLPPERTTIQSNQIFRLDAQQMQVLERLAEPDQLIAELSEEHSLPLPGTPAQQHHWAQTTLAMLAQAGHNDPKLQQELALLVFLSQGAFLEHSDLPALLAQTEPLAIRQTLQNRLSFSV